MENRRKYLKEMGFIPIEGTDILFSRGTVLINILSETEDFKEYVSQVICETENADVPEVKEMYKIGELPFDIDIESEQHFFISKELESIPTPIIRRVSYSGNRFYFEEIDGIPIIYSSGTTIIKNGFVDTLNMLEQWKTKERILGHDPNLYASRRAALGDCMHLLYGIYLSGDAIELKPDFIWNLITSSTLKTDKELLKYVHDNYMNELIEDLISFAIFVKERQVVPLAIEKMLRSKEHVVASPIDLLCTMDEEVEGYYGEVYKTKCKDGEKGDPKLSKQVVRVSALIDYKSNRTSSFWPDNVLQLGLYKILVEENYPNIKVDKLYNFSPKDPRKWSPSSPSYYLKDQTESKELEKLKCVLEQGRLNHLMSNKCIVGYKGKIKYGSFEQESSYVIREKIEDVISRIQFDNKSN